MANLKQALFALGTILILLLSGCAATRAEKSDDGGVPASAPPAVATADTGGISGVVVDDEARPVANASVGIRLVGTDQRNQTRTATDGAYSFSGLAPGAYEISIHALFHEPKMTKVSVIAGEIAEVKTVLIPTPSADPIIEVHVKKGLITCSVGYYLVTGTYSTNPCQNVLGNNANFKLPLNPELAFREVVLELVWTPATGVSSSALRMILCSEKDATTNVYGQCVTAVGANPYYQAVSGSSPLVLRRNNLPVKTVKTYEVAVGDAGFNTTSMRVPVTFQQSFDLYMSLCYNQNCTAEYQARPPK